MPRIRLIALHDITSGGWNVKAGAEFECKPIEAAAFTYTRQAKFASSLKKAPKASVLVAETPEAPIAAPPEAQAETTPRRRRRTYRRADMVAER